MKRTRVEQLRELLRGQDFRIVMDHKVEDGINAARMTLKATWFDVYKCKFGLEALRQYRTEFDEKTNAFKKTPKHDWTSHTADAFRYLAMAWKELKPAPIEARPQNHVLTALPGGLIQSNMSVRDIIEARKRKREAD